MSYFRTEKLAVGYNKKTLISGIDLELEKGRIMTLIGPNGAGKSTILKTITKQIDPIDGDICIDGTSLKEMSLKDLSKKMAVVLTDRIKPELMSCFEVVAMGRYPFTNMFGKLTDADIAAVNNAIATVHAEDIAGQDFATLSDGQRQRIMLARAICQEPEILILDEPTAYLDIRYKIELLDILTKMAREKGITIIMSLHEIELALNVSDIIVCVNGENIESVGTSRELLDRGAIERVYEIGDNKESSLWKYYDRLISSIKDE